MENISTIDFLLFMEGVSIIAFVLGYCYHYCILLTMRIPENLFDDSLGLTGVDVDFFMRKRQNNKNQKISLIKSIVKDSLKKNKSFTDVLFRGFFASCVLITVLSKIYGFSGWFLFIYLATPLLIPPYLLSIRLLPMVFLVFFRIKASDF